MTFPYHVIDLTHTLTPAIPTWEGTVGFKQEVLLDYGQCTTEPPFCVQQFTLEAGLGTHLDAPAHCIPHGLTVDKLPLSDLLVPCVMIDVSAKAHASYRISPDDLIAFEQQHGPVPPRSFVVFHTGWARFWADPIKYRNNLVFPCVAKETAELLLKRDIAGLGIDTLSPDRPDGGYPVHQIILGSKRYLVENVANADRLPAKGSFALILPTKVQGATEAWVRLLALVSP
ncbi:metal-dependent hydrolase [Legionella rubrilucens]|uniref:Metal-dependent hydrolase n=1 Tax=Legionella rubrilucens TaxID=458 RepID=A0A0W0XYI1_9GAMM|nr:cyclase family protein [Legionella rubrilucens]KTD49458.1 metal-dependent hydrolase [Legionella rubrilucens]